MRRILIAPALVAVALLYAWVDPEHGIRACARLRGELGRAQQRVATLDGEVEALRAQVAALRDDPLAQEAAIREDLELARPGETVVRILPAEPEARDFLDALERAGDSPPP